MTTSPATSPMNPQDLPPNVKCFDATPFARPDRAAERLPKPIFSNRAFAISFIVTILIALTLLLAPKAGADGGSATWLPTPTTGNWIPDNGNNPNWTTGNNKFPGSTSVLTNTDTATFLTSNTTTIGINSTTLNFGSLTFGSTTTAPSSYTIGATNGNSLLLTSSGQISLSSGFTGATNLTELINAPIVMEPPSNVTAGTYTFSNSAGANSNVLQFAGAISGGSTSQGITLTLTGANTGATSSTGGNLISGAISNGNAAGGVAVSKTSSGTWILTGNNTYTATTAISGGTLTAAGTGGNQALGGTSGITLNTGGTLLQTTSNQINNTAGMALSGGTYRLNTVSEGTTAPTGNGVGALTLTTNSIIDLAGTDVLHFANSSGQTWTGTLSIYNYSGTPFTGNAAEQLLVGSNASGLTQAQLDSISFYSGSGTGFLGTAGFTPDMDGELAPVPEPSTWAAGLLAVAAVAYSQLRKGSRAGGRRLSKKLKTCRNAA